MQTTDDYIEDCAEILADGIRADFSGDDEQGQQAEPINYRIAEASDHIRTHGDDPHHSGFSGIIEATGVEMDRAEYEEALADALHAIATATR